jgi:hypothetical protein
LKTGWRDLFAPLVVLITDWNRTTRTLLYVSV